MNVETILNHARRLSDEDKQYLHREIARMLAPLYGKKYRDRYESGVQAARGRIASRR